VSQFVHQHLGGKGVVGGADREEVVESSPAVAGGVDQDDDVVAGHACRCVVDGAHVTGCQVAVHVKGVKGGVEGRLAVDMFSGHVGAAFPGGCKHGMDVEFLLFRGVGFHGEDGLAQAPGVGEEFVSFLRGISFGQKKEVDMGCGVAMGKDLLPVGENRRFFGGHLRSGSLSRLPGSGRFSRHRRSGECRFRSRGDGHISVDEIVSGVDFRFEDRNENPVVVAVFEGQLHLLLRKGKEDGVVVGPVDGTCFGGGLPLLEKGAEAPAEEHLSGGGI